MGGSAGLPALPERMVDSMKNGIWNNQADGPGVWRRSVYVYRKRGLPFPFFEVFDLPDQNITCGRRNISTVATQALTLLNNEFVLDQAKHFAARVEKLAPGDRNEQLETAYELALSRKPTAEERKIGSEFLAKNSLQDLAHVIMNFNEFIYLR